MGLDVRDVSIRTAVPGSTPDHRESDVVLRIQCHPPTRLTAKTEAPLRLTPLLRASSQRGARTRRLKAQPRNAWRSLSLLERPPHGPPGRRRHLRPQAIDQVLRQPFHSPRRRRLLPCRHTPEYSWECVHPAQVTLVQNVPEARLSPVPPSLCEQDQLHLSTRRGRPPALSRS